MSPAPLPHAWGEPQGSAVIRACPEDFLVREQLGFDLSGEGEHLFLHLEKRELNTLELQERLSQLSGVALRDIGYSGMKDRNAVTRQWFSVGLAGKPEPDWRELESRGDVLVLETGRHRRKLKRGVHKSNLFELRLRALRADKDDLEVRLRRIAAGGVPNYFGEQRFGRNGNTLSQARQWAHSGRRKISRTKRGLFLSALRAFLFNELLARRVQEGTWDKVCNGDVCMLQGTRSQFVSAEVDEEIERRASEGDLHVGLPLWGRGDIAREAGHREALAEFAALCDFLEREDLDASYRPARLMADDFCWQFCDDDSLQLNFMLGAGGYATAVLAELVQNNNNGVIRSGNGSE